MNETVDEGLPPYESTAGLPWGTANINTIEGQIDQMGRLGQAPEGWRRTAGKATAAVLLPLYAVPPLFGPVALIGDFL